MTLRDLEGAWTLQRPATGGVQTLEARARVREGLLEISVPAFGAQGLVIRGALQGEVLSAQFEIGTTRGTVDLRVRAEGTRLVGNPTAFANRERWQFSRQTH